MIKKREEEKKVAAWRKSEECRIFKDKLRNIVNKKNNDINDIPF